jgi:fumarate reductase flavoprotein subunit
MVERCADCGFDLVSGLVEVVPTAHYMMGGVVFRTDCSTDLPGLFAAGEDTGGVHGANRLGGNGVANSTVYGGIAGDTMGAWVAGNGVFHEPDEGAIEAGAARVTRPFGAGSKGPATGLSDIRTRLHDLMWDDVGIFRDAASLARASGVLEELDARLDTTGVADGQRAFNLTWHDWINLKNLVLVSQAIRGAAEQREDSRGAHFRNDHPDVRDLENSRYTTVRIDGGRFDYGTRPVVFSRVKPGQSLVG